MNKYLKFMIILLICKKKIKLLNQIEGNWVENKIVEGRWILPNGNFYEGKFENNKPNGNGIKIY